MMKTQPVIAYRIWKVSPEGRLYTAYRENGKWPWMKPYSAACDKELSYNFYGIPVIISASDSKPLPAFDHDAPHFDCACGLYGYKSVKCLEQTFPTFYRGNCVLGRVALWGKVVEHADGYRAEYGYPQVLYVSDSVGPLTERGEDTLHSRIRTAAQKYGIDIAPRPEEIAIAFDQFVEKKRLEERQLREDKEKMARADGLWVDEVKYTAPYYQFPKEWEKKNEALKKHFNPYTGKSFMSRIFGGNI